MDALVIAGMVLFVIVVIALGAVVMVGRLYQKVDQGKALIINKLKADPDVTFTGGIVLPVIHRVETMDISVKTIEVDRRGDDGLICKDNIRADIKVTFFVRVNKTSDDVLKVAQSIGCQRASDQNTLEQLFAAKFSEALKTVGKWLEFEELYTKRDAFRDQIIKIIGKDLNGYVLEDAAIDYLEQTPLSRLDPSNILDAQGIRKITMITAAQNVQTNELKQKERMEIGQQDLTADEAIFRYDQQRAEAEARKQREIDVAETREQNEAKRYQVEEDKQTDLAKQVAQEEIQRKEQEVLRNVEVAQKQRERVVTIEAVEVQKAHDLKQVEREREVELQRIEKEKQIEREKKEIADVIRGRIAVDKTVAEEEERIKDLRATAEATRVKDVAVITAEGEAQAELVKSLKAAEAEQEVAKFRASERITLAQAELEASEKLAAGKIRLAEGIQAESAAEGLAKVRVAEQEAGAIEKQGLAKAKVTREQMSAEAEGSEKQGLVDVKIREANALAIEKVGQAEASAIEKRMEAEAQGLTLKVKAMEQMSPAAAAHEEFRIQLEQQREIALKGIETKQLIAEAQARLLGQAFGDAKFQIVGGDGQFFQKFVQALSLGNAVDGAVEHSAAARGALADYITGDASLREDIKDVLSNGGIDKVKDMAVAKLVSKLATGDTAQQTIEAATADDSTDA
ncbi:MAG: putative membrane protein YqiK [Bradymonadia bacterium]|jgi:uncharacterized membrane protein YqiK